MEMLDRAMSESQWLTAEEPVTSKMVHVKVWPASRLSVRTPTPGANCEVAYTLPEADRKAKGRGTEGVGAGLMAGDEVGEPVKSEGTEEGTVLGLSEGTEVGESDGAVDGVAVVGKSEGAEEGTVLGVSEGTKVAESDGAVDGLAVGVAYKRRDIRRRKISIYI